MPTYVTRPTHPARLTFMQLEAREGKTVRHSVRPRLYRIISARRAPSDGGYITVVSVSSEDAVVSLNLYKAGYRVSECGEVIGYEKTTYFADLDDPFFAIPDAPEPAFKDDHGFRLPASPVASPVYPTFAEPAPPWCVAPVPTGKFIGPIPQGLERNADGTCMTYDAPAQPFVHRHATQPLRERVRRPASYNPFDTGAGRRDSWDS